VATLSRDGVTWLVYSCMSVYGYFVYGFGPTVPLIGADLDVSRAVAGLHGTALAVGAVLAGLIGPALVGRFGRGTTLRVGLAGLAIGLTGYLHGTSIAMSLTGAAIAGTFGSMVVNTHSAVLSHQYGSAGPAAISEANALAAGFGLLAPVVIGAAAAAGLGWRAGLLLACVAAVVVLAATVRIGVPAGPVPPALDTSRRDTLPAAFWPALAVLVLCIGTEFSLTFWSSELLRERTGTGTAVATGSVAALVAGMTVGRIVGGKVALVHDADRLLSASFGLALIGFTLLWTSTTLWLSVTGLGIVGLGLAVQFPLSIARVIAASGGRPDLATARASIGAGIAIGTAPFLLGYLADLVGTHRAFLLVPALLALAALALRVSRPAPHR